VPRAQPGEISTTSTTYTQRLRNGKVVTRTRQRATQGLRARRQSAATMVPAKPFIGPALEQGREEAIAAMGARLQKELDKAGQS
jgi:hypothetical protein